MLALPPLPPQIADFFAKYERVDGKFELVDGQVIDGRGGTVGHAQVIGNVLIGLTARLRGTGFEVFNGQIGLLKDAATVFYPDVAVYGDRRDLDLPGETQVLRHPKVIVEVTSPATLAADHGYKLTAYKLLESTAAVVLIDPVEQRLDLHERVGPEQWSHERLPPGSGLALRDPAVELSFGEIFATE